MQNKYLISFIWLFVVWALMDFVIHGVVLGESYKATAELWRPMGEFKHGLMYSISALFVIAFIALYARYFAEKSVKRPTAMALRTSSLSRWISLPSWLPWCRNRE